MVRLRPEVSKGRLGEPLHQNTFCMLSSMAWATNKLFHSVAQAKKLMPSMAWATIEKLPSMAWATNILLPRMICTTNIVLSSMTWAKHGMLLTFGKFSILEVKTSNAKVRRADCVLEKEFCFLSVSQVRLIEHVTLTIFYTLPINARVPRKGVKVELTWVFSPDITEIFGFI